MFNWTPYCSETTNNADENNRQLNRLLRSSSNTEEEKRSYKKSKEDFDEGYLQACKDLRNQIAVFDSQFVHLDDPLGQAYEDEKFLPRSFTLYTLVQRFLLKEEMDKNNVWWSYKNGNCHTALWSPVRNMQWTKPCLTLAHIYRSVMFEVLSKKVLDSQQLVTEIQTAVDLSADRGTVEKDYACLQEMFPALPPVLLKDLFQFSLYFGFEDMFIYSKRPCWKKAYLDLWPPNYFRVLLEEPEELKKMPVKLWPYYGTSPQASFGIPYSDSESE